MSSNDFEKWLQQKESARKIKAGDRVKVRQEAENKRIEALREEYKKTKGL
jgi:hypothetical protein